MSALSTYAQNKILDHLLGATSFTPPATLYLALQTSLSSDSAQGTEATGGSYARPSITNNATNFPAASGGYKKNGTAITTATATAPWGTIVDAALMDASSSGNMITHGALTVATPITTGEWLTFAINDFSVRALMTSYASPRVLDWLLGGGTLTAPATYHLGLFTTTLDATVTGTEVTGGSYVRPSITNNSTNFPAASGGAKGNGVAIPFPTATAVWGTGANAIKAWALFDAASAGNAWFYGNMLPANYKDVGISDQPRISIGELVINLNT